MLAFILLAIGGLNWGLSALGYNVVNLVLGSWPVVEKLVYLLVGVSAVAELVMHKGSCKMCNSSAANPAM